MKKISGFLTACAFLFLSACNSGDKTAEASTDSATVETTPEPAPAPAPPKPVVLIWHKVSNFATWLPGYESHDSTRLAAGLHNYVVGRDISDTNMVLVAMRMDDLEKAKAFTSSPELGATMKKLGVTGAPAVNFLDVQMSDTTANSATRLMMQHKVKDYDAFRKVFDANKQARMDAGLTDRAMSCEFGDKNNVTLVFAVNDLAKAKAFTASDDLKNKMADAGVVGAPIVHYYTVAKTW